jgi:hypothetical protein
MCAQDFTRKYSAYRHNRDLHQGRGNIVRTLEYVIGRVSGDYPTADPKTFRKNRAHSPYGNIGKPQFVNVAHDRSYSQSSQTLQGVEHGVNQTPTNEPVGSPSSGQFVDQTTSKLEEIKLLVQKIFPGMDADIFLNMIGFKIIQGKGDTNLDNYLQVLQGIRAFSTRTSSESTEKPLLKLHPKLRDLPPEAQNMLAQIQKLLSSNPDNHPNPIWEEIEQLAKNYRITKDLNIIRVTLDYHKSGGPVQI